MTAVLDGRLPKVRVRRLAVAVALCVLALPVRASADSGWSVTSSIPDGASLSGAVQWSAALGGDPPGGLDRVEFLIDGVVRWTEHNTPFVFNNDDNYLYPYILGLGAHRLEIRAVAKDGEQATADASVRVTQAAPRTPRALRGTWARRVTQREIDRSYRPGVPSPPAGLYRLQWRAGGVAVVQAPGLPKPNDYAFAASSRGALTAGGPLNWLTATGKDEGYCNGAQTFARYHWRTDRSDLRLRIVRDPCPVRAAILAGTWKKR